VKGVSRKAQHAKADPLANSIIASIEGAMFVSRIEAFAPALSWMCSPLRRIVLGHRLHPRPKIKAQEIISCASYFCSL
jgi:hypothetical protein